MDEYQQDNKAYQRDYESTKESQKYEQEYTLANRAMNHVENMFHAFASDLKKEIENRLDRLEKMIKDVKFTRKTTIWIIFISAASLAAMIIQLLLSR